MAATLTFTEQDFAPKGIEFTEADFEAPAASVAVSEPPPKPAEIPRESGGMPMVEYSSGPQLMPLTTMQKVKTFRIPGQYGSVWSKLFGEEKAAGHDPGAIEAAIASPASMLGPSGMVGKGIAAWFTLNFLKDQPAVLEQLKDEVKRGDTRSAAHTILGDLIGAALIVTGGRELLVGGHPAAAKGEPAVDLAHSVEAMKQAKAPATAEAVRAVIPDVPLNPGGAAKDLLPELAAQSKANNSREAFTKLQAEAVAKTTPPPDKPVAVEFPTGGENIEMRKSAARAVDSPPIPEAVQETIAKAPESFYVQQSTKEVANTVGTMLDADLAGVPRDSNLYVAAKLEQAKRMFAAGKNDEGYEVFVELEKEGTRLGQLINQFKFLESVNPESVATIIDKRLAKTGHDPLTKPQREVVIEATKESQSANRELDAAKDEWMRNPSDENAAKAEDALNKSNDAEIELQQRVDRHEVRTIPGTLSTILKGNLLTPISQMANVIGNVSFIPFRSSARAVASGIDVIDAFVRNRPREIAVSPIEGTKEAIKGIGRGLAQVPGIIKSGSGTIKGEKSTGLHPLRAWVEQFSKNPDVPTVGGKVPYSERVRLALESTLGIPAETMLRGLAAGDRPFRESAQARIVANELKLAKIPKDKWDMAQKFPELFFDRPTMERIQEETLSAIFQRQSNSIRYIMKLFSSRGDWMELAASTVAPYKLTPWNIATEILSYNPVVAAAQTTYFAKQGNSRAAKMSAGKLVVGSMLTAAGFYLYKQGLLAPSMDSPDERTKARILAGEIMPPNHINVSGLERLTTGGDPAFRPGDKTMDVFRAGGLAGSMFYMTANIGRDMEKQPAADDDVLMSILRNSTIEQARFAMNQSFLQGVGGLFEAIKGGDTDGYVKKWANTTMSIALPNTLNTLSRATRPEKIQTEGFEDLVRSRLGVFGADDMLPLKRGLWGEPIPETPNDRSAVIYHFFDITKQRQVTDDPVAIEIYKLWRASNDTEVIPTPPGKSVTFNKQSYTLNAQQQSNLAELVGKARRAYAEAIVSNTEWTDLPAELKIKVLGQVYDKGLEVGKAQYFLSEPKLEPKKKPAGFNN